MKHQNSVKGDSKMKHQNSAVLENNEELCRKALGTENDPEAFIKLAWPDIVLEEWQKKICDYIKEEFNTGNKRLKIQVVSGHTTGKSAFCAWIAQWFMTTNPATHGEITSNTEQGLRDKTMGEFGKWADQSNLLNFYFFDGFKSLVAAYETSYGAALNFRRWSMESPDDFSVLSSDSFIGIIDEGAYVPGGIYDVINANCAANKSIFLVTGVPCCGCEDWRFFDIYKSNDWFKVNVDSRDVSFADHKQIKNLIEYYGEDSDFTRIRIRGEFTKDV